MNTKVKATAALGALISAVFFTLPNLGVARADNFVFTNEGTSSVVYLNGVSSGVYAGEYAATFNGTSINIFCTDFTHEISDGNHYPANSDYSATAAAGPLTANPSLTTDGYYDGGLASAITQIDYDANVGAGTMSVTQRAHEVAYLANTYLGDSNFTGSLSGYTSTNANLAGVSLAIWDIIQDGGDGLASGNGSVDLNDTTSSWTAADYSEFVTLGDYYENQALNAYNANGGSDLYSNVDWLQAPRTMNSNGTGNTTSNNGHYSHLQDYVTNSTDIIPLHTSPAPEPSFSMLLLSFILIGGAIRFRRWRADGV
jgi:hypothetical protein